MSQAPPTEKDGAVGHILVSMYYISRTWSWVKVTVVVGNSVVSQDSLVAVLRARRRRRADGDQEEIVGDHERYGAGR